MRMDHDPAPRSIFPRFGFRYWPKTVIRSKCSEWLLRAHTVSSSIVLRALAAPKILYSRVVMSNYLVRAHRSFGSYNTFKGRAHSVFRANSNIATLKALI